MRADRRYPAAGTRGITYARGGIRNALLTPPNPPPLLVSCPSAAQTAPGHMLGGLPLGHSVNAGSGINNALRVPARAYAIPRTPAAG